MSSLTPVYQWQAWIVHNWKGANDVIHFHPDKMHGPNRKLLGFYRREN